MPTEASEPVAATKVEAAAPVIPPTATPTPAAAPVAKSGSKTPLILGLLLFVCLLCAICGGVGYYLYTQAANAANKAIESGFEDAITDAIENEIENNSGSDVNLDFGDGADLPANFPNDVPIYAGAKVTSSISGEDAMTVTLSVAGKSETEVRNFYRDELKSRGWNITGEYSFGISTLSAEKDTRSVVLGFFEDESGKEVTVSISVSEKE
jgi:hypothetical protein